MTGARLTPTRAIGAVLSSIIVLLAFSGCRQGADADSSDAEESISGRGDRQDAHSDPQGYDYPSEKAVTELALHHIERLGLLAGAAPTR